MMTTRYLSSSEVAELIGVQPDTLNRYALPPPDVMVGKVRGWRRETILKWHRNRPSQRKAK
jgi:predicted DNA-binding transcriptional regulator AlpA